MRGYRARILDHQEAFIRNVVRLAVVDADRGAYLMPDGTWLTVAEADRQPADIGIALPREAIEAIAVAIQEWQGHGSHADTEARVLREWLAVERDRVDRTLAR